MADDNKIIVDLLVEGVDKFKADLKGGQDAVEKFTTEAKQGTTEAKQGFEQLGKSTESFKSQLKTMTSELIAANIQLAEMQDAGQQGTKEFTALEKKISDLTKKAGTLKDAIGDANQVISQAGSDTAGLDKAIRAVATATAAFQVFEGAAVLAGKGNEDLQKALVKLNAVMAITQGLQQIQNELTRNDSVFKGMAAKATALYNVVVGQSTGALKAFRLALAATGIGLAIVGIVALIENWDKLKTAIGLSTYNLDQFNKKLQEGNEYIDGRTKAQQRDLLEMEKIGKKESEIAAQRLAFAKENESLSLERLNQLREEEIASRGNKEANKKILEEITKQQDDYYEKTINTTKAEIALDKALAAEKKANAEKQKQLNDEAAKALRTKIEKDVSNRKLEVDRSKFYNDQLLKDRQEYLKSLQDAEQRGEDFRLNIFLKNQERRKKEIKEEEEKADAIIAAIRKRNAAEQKTADEAPTRADILVENAKRVQGIYEQVQSVISQTLDIVSNATQIRSENEIRALEKKRDRGLITEKQYEREVAKIKNEEARKNKIAQTIQAFAMIPMAILQALTSIPFPANIAAAAVVGALATAQAAIVAASPLPKFKQGGSVAKKLGLMRGKSHEQGGIPIEVEGNEYVMNQKAVRKYGVDFMDSINNLKLSPAVTMQAKLDNLNNTDYKLYEHLSTLGSYMKQDYRANETGNNYLRQLIEVSKTNKTYV